MPDDSPDPYRPDGGDLARLRRRTRDERGKLAAAVLAEVMDATGGDHDHHAGAEGCRVCARALDADHRAYVASIAEQAGR